MVESSTGIVAGFENLFDKIREGYRHNFVEPYTPVYGSEGKDYLVLGFLTSYSYTIVTVVMQTFIRIVIPNSRIGTLIFNIVGTWWTILGLYWTSGYLYIAYTFITEGRQGLDF